MRVNLPRVAFGAVVLAMVAQACGDSTQKKQPLPNSTGEGASAAEPSDEGAGTGPGPEGGSAANESGAAGATSSGAGASGDAPSGGSNACPEGPAGKAPSDYLAQFASGSRLQARFYAAAGLPDTFAGFFDSKLGVWCDFLRASDDKLRCLPRTTANSFNAFGDSGCRRRITVVSHACASGAAGYFRDQLECSDKVAIHGAAAYAGPTYGGAPTNCTQTARAAPADTVAVSDEIAPTAFVEGKLRELPGICNATLRLVDAADGALGPFEVFDIPSGASCITVDGSCRPRRLAYEEPLLFTDAACETAVTTTYASSPDDPSCGPPDLVRLGAAEATYTLPGPLVGGALFSSISGCSPALDKPWIKSIYEVTGTEVTLVTLERQLLGEGRLRLPVATERDKPLIAALAQEPYFQDNELDAPCLLRPIVNGTLRCFPSKYLTSAGIVDEYGDDKCTLPVRRCQGSDCVGAYVYDDELDPEGCSSDRPTTDIWQINAPASGYYRMDAQNPCYPAGSISPDMWTVEAVQPEDLPQATLETLP